MNFLKQLIKKFCHILRNKNNFVKKKIIFIEIFYDNSKKMFEFESSVNFKGYKAE